MTGTTEAAQDISFEAMKEKQEEVVKIVMADPAVQAVGSFFGGGAFGAALNNGRMFIILKPKGIGKGDRIDDVGVVIARLRQKLAKIQASSFSFNRISTFAWAAGCRKGFINTRSRTKILMS